MNFFCVGFFITAFQLNMSWSANYIIKPVGLLFIFGGLWELAKYNLGYKKLMPVVRNILIISALPAVFFPILTLLKIHQTVMNIFGLIVGGFVALIVIELQKKIFDVMEKDKESFNDFSAVERLKGTWKKLVYFTIASIGFNIFNLVPVRIIADLAGLGMAICRIGMYILAVIMLWRFTKVSSDYYKKNR